MSYGQGDLVPPADWRDECTPVVTELERKFYRMPCMRFKTGCKFSRLNDGYERAMELTHVVLKDTPRERAKVIDGSARKTGMIRPFSKSLYVPTRRGKHMSSARTEKYTYKGYDIEVTPLVAFIGGIMTPVSYRVGVYAFGNFHGNSVVEPGGKFAALQQARQLIDSWVD